MALSSREKKLCQQRVYNTTKGSNVDGDRRKKASRKEKDVMKKASWRRKEE